MLYLVAALTGPLAAASVKVEWEQTANFGNGKYNLGKKMPAFELSPMDAPSDKAFVIDRSTKFQSLHGFGGAFTEASALNWRALSKKEQAEVMNAYFGKPEDGGLGYTVGRVPMGSCDFGPGDAKRYYNFANVSEDFDLKYFDDTVSMDVSNGIIPMIKTAMEYIKDAGGELTLFASPWSPPQWMKLPVEGVKSMMLSAKPNGLNPDPRYQRAYAHYFARFISAYKKHGIPMWGVTPQNEAEAGDVGWEKCLYTPEFQAQFVSQHLRPVLDEIHPGTKIIGFDHNKDHVYIWAKGLYATPETRAAFDGIGVHWYGGLNTANLESTHSLAPEKFILATESCNCPSAIFEKVDADEWWQRAEHLGIDILEDLLHWATGWVDWNLVVDITGGPNHLGNRCDANIVADPTNKLGYGTTIYQASYYYMGHFSRFLPAGSKRIDSQNSVVEERELDASDVVNSSPLVFLPCSGSALQSWTLDETGSLFIENTGTDPALSPMCIDVSNYGKGPRLDVYSCSHAANQGWERKVISSCTAAEASTQGKSCSQLINPTSGMCLTKIAVSGAAVGLDAGSTFIAAQARPCLMEGDPSQTFDVIAGDDGGFPGAFPVRSPASVTGDRENDKETCLQPYIAKEPEFDAVAFETPDGGVSVVAMNKGEEDLTFTLYDKSLGMGATAVTVPAHSIQSYKLPKLPTLPTPAALLAEPQPTGQPAVKNDEAMPEQPKTVSKTAPTAAAAAAPTAAAAAADIAPTARGGVFRDDRAPAPTTTTLTAATRQAAPAAATGAARMGASDAAWPLGAAFCVAIAAALLVKQYRDKGSLLVAARKPLLDDDADTPYSSYHPPAVEADGARQ